MSDIAYTIHLFTKGEGQLKTTQDLFARAAYFLQQGVILYAIIKEFSTDVPSGYLKDDLLKLLEKVPLHCQQLKHKLKQTTVGKTATFNKVCESSLLVSDVFKHFYRKRETFICNKRLMM
jgi:hypothetical protein